MIEFRTLRKEELPKWYEHCSGVFGLEDKTYFQRHYECDPAGDCSLIFVAVEGDEIAATVRVFDREMYLSGRAVRMGGIGEVSTKPAYRRQGLCGTLLAMSIDEMARRGIPISVLFGQKPLYERAGWRFCPVPWKDIDTKALPPLPENASVRAFTPEDLPLVMGLYDISAGRLNGAILRNETYWKRWVLPQWRPAQLLLVDGQPVAYACLRSPEEDGLRYLDELCALPHAESLLPAFLGALAGGARVRVITPQLPSVPGDDATHPRLMMVRSVLPFDEIQDTDALVRAVGDTAGTFGVDHF